ncbi:MAG: NADH-quinone oxidoreductase subunit M [Alphaproteobacteria bacterium]|nr:NADH-quinone oxidoreductase subunit M [Alphaproteobacteria bacterium]
MSVAELPWASQSPVPLLALLQLLPAVAALLLVFLRRERVVRGVALGAALAEVLLSWHLYRVFDAGRPGLQLVERAVLFGPVGYHAGADGLTVLFLLLTAFISLMVVLYGLIRRFDPQWRYFAVVLASQSAVTSQFCSVDMLWFTLLSAAQVWLAGELLRNWSTSPEGESVVTRFYQFMGVGLLLLLGGLSMMGWQHADATGGQWTFDAVDLATNPVPEVFQSAIFYLLFYGLAIRIPLFPLHGWLPVTAEHGTLATALVFLLGLKTGVYGLLRFVFPLLPEAVWQWHGYAVAFAAAGIFYAALLALMQKNLRRLLAYAVVSHTSVLVIGLFSLTGQAFQGSAILAVNFGLAAAGLLLMTGLVFQRTGTVMLAKLGGLWDRLPLIAIAFLVAGLAIVGMPGTPGFDAAHLMLESAIQRFGALVTIAAALGNVAAAGFLLWAFERAFLRAPPPDAGRQKVVPRATRIEAVLASSLIIVQLSAGFFSEPWLKLVETSTQSLGARYEHLIGGHGE